MTVPNLMSKAFFFQDLCIGELCAPPCCMIRQKYPRANMGNALFFTRNRIFLICRHDNLYLSNGNFQFIQQRALWIKTFYLQPPAKRLKAVESQITFLVWPWLSLTEKQPIVNHMIIFNGSISKLYKCWQQLHERNVVNFNSKYQFQRLASSQHNNLEKIVIT